MKYLISIDTLTHQIEDIKQRVYEHRLNEEFEIYRESLDDIMPSTLHILTSISRSMNEYFDGSLVCEPKEDILSLEIENLTTKLMHILNDYISLICIREVTFVAISEPTSNIRDIDISQIIIEEN